MRQQGRLIARSEPQQWCLTVREQEARGLSDL